MKTWIARVIWCLLGGLLMLGVGWLNTWTVSDPAKWIIQSLDAGQGWERAEPGIYDDAMGRPCYASRARNLRIVTGRWLATVHLSHSRHDQLPTQHLSWLDRLEINRALLRLAAREEAVALSVAPQ